MSVTLPTLEEVERRHILLALLETRGHMTASAKILGIDRRTLYRKVKLFPELRSALKSSRIQAVEASL